VNPTVCSSHFPPFSLTITHVVKAGEMIYDLMMRSRHEFLPFLRRNENRVRFFRVMEAEGVGILWER